MNLSSLQLLQEALCRPLAVEQLRIGDWDLLLRQARASDCLARLGERVEAASLLGSVPPSVAQHLHAAQLLTRRQQSELVHEILAVRDALATVGIPLLLLKGAAYAQARLHASKGRMVSDVDILVSKDRLPDAESALMRAGWITTTHDEYDQKYYREWMHEIPPLRHLQRGVVLDVHHAVVPPTAGYCVDSRQLFEASVSLSEEGSVRMLCNEDLVLHSAVHLMHEGELEMGFRGLLDLDALVTEFSAADPAFWTRLAERAVLLNLQRPAFLALRYTHLILKTDIPDTCLQALKDRSPRLGRMRLAALDALYTQGLRPHHSTLDDRFSGLARWVLYMRSHLLRMPLHLLLPHLMRKFFMRLQESLKGQKGAKDAQA